MICWVASYPRSGNTLTRTILRDCFGIESYTHFLKEPETDHLFPNQTKYDFNDKSLYQSLKSEDRIYYVKTHYAVFDDSPVIHIVRNGRNAILSYSNLLKTQPLGVMLGNNIQFPTWSGHYWAFAGRPNSLLVRFEDLLENTDRQVERIGQFIKQKPKPFINNFEPVNRVMGTQGKTYAQFSDFEELYFQRMNGTVMGVLGYA